MSGNPFVSSGVSGAGEGSQPNPSNTQESIKNEVNNVPQRKSIGRRMSELLGN